MNSSLRCVVHLLLPVVFLSFATPALRAEETLDPARQAAITSWLPAEPAGFAWPITNRAAWEQLGANAAFAEIIPQADKALAKALPLQPDGLYLEFSQTGNRTHWQKVASDRRGRVEKFTLAEAIQNQGRYLPALETTIAALCQEKTWVMPAHDGGLQNFHGKAITPDLGATGLAAELAEADYVLGDRLSPATRQRIREHINRRVLAPFRAMIEGRQKEAFWVRTPMNWNAVCVGNTVFAALTLVNSREERGFYAAAGEHCIHYYLSGFTADGYCAEGVGYWNFGYGHFILLTEALRQATGGRLDLLKDDKAIAAALFCRRSEILPGIFPTISDVNPGTKPSPQLTAYVCRRLGLPAKESQAGMSEGLAMGLMLSSLPENLPVARQLDGYNDSPLRSFFPGGGVLLARNSPDQSPAFAVALKGGNNNEPHNHNDVGSFSLVLNRDMVVCDPGGEVYTARTFSAHRYDSKVLSSYGHAVPVVAGQLQKAGADARGIILASNFTATADTYQLDITSAYPVADLTSLVRTFVFERGARPALEVRDAVAFDKPEAFASTLVTWGTVQAAGSDALIITDGESAVRVTIDTGGRAFKWHQDIIDEDVDTKRKPVHVLIELADKIVSGGIKLRIQPVGN